LLYGPPGCGKTYLARATAGQINAGFISIGIHDVLDMWIGSSEKKLHEIFELARRQTPCVIFFDEIDALGASRSDMRHSASKMLINQFLTELDGVQASNDGLLILGATNAPWHLDAAFRRPGRFDRIIFVQPPDTEGRENILKILLKDKPLGQIDYALLAKQTQDFSGADLKAVIDVAIEEKLRESFEKGMPQPIQNKDLLNAVRQVKPSTKEWFTTARNYALYANDSGLYDEILDFLKIKK
jgi:transitional endoplasmic reticulum ATPase